MMKIAIVGSRGFSPLSRVQEFVDSLALGTVVVSGGARGVDTTAESSARSRGLCCEIYLPDWKKYGRSAGFVRNRLIVEAADKVIAFWDGTSRGTKHSIDLAKKLNKELEIIQPYTRPATQNVSATEPG